MPIRNQIEAIVNQLTVPADDPDAGPITPAFLYGTGKELNNQADDIAFPVVFMYTLQPIDLSYTLSNSVNDAISIYLEFLFKTEFGEYTASNEAYVSKALDLAKQFMVKLANYRQSPNQGRFFKVHENDRAKSVPVYNKFDVNSTGVNLQITVSTMYSTNIQP